MNAPNWIRIAAVADCPPGSALECVAGDRIVALFNVDGEFHALDGICPHQGGPLGQGELAGSVVTCPWHGFQFDVCTGRNVGNPALMHPSFPVKVEQGEVYVEIGG